MITCPKLFSHWVKTFKNDKGVIGIRCVKTDKIWRSDDAKTLFGTTSNYGTWNGPRGVSMLNDADIQAAQSRALKLGGDHFSTMLLSNGKAYDLMARAKHCKCSLTSCAVLVYWAVPRSAPRPVAPAFAALLLFLGCLPPLPELADLAASVF